MNNLIKIIKSSNCCKCFYFFKSKNQYQNTNQIHVENQDLNQQEDQNQIQDLNLLCDQCNIQFDLYCEPKLLACFKTICNECETEIEKEAIDNQFKCKICLDIHNIPNEKFPINKDKHTLILLANSIKTSDENIQLNSNLNKIKQILAWLNDLESECHYILYEHCIEQKRLIQLDTETQLIQQESNSIDDKIQNLNETLIDSIDDYEAKCKEIFRLKINKSNINKLIQSTQAKLNEISHLESIELLSNLNYKLKKLKNLIFNNNKIEYRSGNLVYNPCFTNMLSTSIDGNIKVWDIESNECIKTYETNQKISCIKKASNNKIIVGTENGCISFWNLITGKCIHTLKNEHAKQINAILLISDTTFATSSRDHKIKLFDLNTFKCIQTYLGHADEVTDIDKLITENNDCKLVSCSFDCTIRVWDLNRDTSIKKIAAEERHFLNIKVICNKTVATTSSFCFNEILIWNIETEECLKKIEENWISCIVRLSNEEICCSNLNGEIKCLNINNAHEDHVLCQIQAHSERICSLVKLSQDSVVSCSWDGKIKIWNIHTGLCLNTLQGQGYNCVDLF